MVTSLQQSIPRNPSYHDTEFQKMVGIIRSIAIRADALCPLIFSSPQIKTSCDYVNQQTKSPAGLPRPMLWSRELVREMEMELIKKISMECLHPNDKIVEIGAGELDSQEQSYLMQRLPQQLRNSVEPTEVNRALNVNTTKLKHVDTLELEKHYSPQSLDSIIGSAVLDTLVEEDLILTLKQMHTVLKDNGYVMHISSREPFIDVLLATYKDENTICFPWLSKNEKFKGLHWLDKLKNSKEKLWLIQLPIQVLLYQMKCKVSNNW